VSITLISAAGVSGESSGGIFELKFVTDAVGMILLQGIFTFSSVLELLKATLYSLKS